MLLPPLLLRLLVDIEGRGEEEMSDEELNSADESLVVVMAGSAEIGSTLLLDCELLVNVFVRVGDRSKNSAIC